jgi:steroid delta-isomerase-like uncharacterized protein
MTGMQVGDQDRYAARIKTVEEHIHLENLHDLEALMGTFGAAARYEVEPVGARHLGRDAVRAFYDGIFQVLPDLHIAVKNRYCSEEALILEVAIRGTHSAEWMGVAATGKRLEFPLCAISTFDGDDKLTGERIYFDRAMILEQMGVPSVGGTAFDESADKALG